MNRSTKKMFTFFLTFLMILFATASTGLPAYSKTSDNPFENNKGHQVLDELLVKFKPGTPAQNKRAIHAQFGAVVKEVIPHIGVEVLKVPAGKRIDEMIRLYEKNPNIIFVEPNFIATTMQTPNDPFFDFQPGLHNVVPLPAWSITTGCPSIPIAVLDTGIFFAHEDLAGRTIPGYDFVNDNADASDDRGHGTLVAGVIGAATDNETGIAGVTWQNPIMPVKVLNSEGTGSYSDVAKGIIFATDNGARVINMSLSGSSPSSTLKSALDYAYNKNVVLVGSAGNNNGPVGYPAAYSNVIAVAAVDNFDSKATYSSYGPQISVTAPGNGVRTTNMSGGYGRATGTSLSAPFVSGLAGLILSVNPALSPAQVEAIIQQGADDLGEPGWDPYYGWGRINLANSLAIAGNLPVLPPKDTIPPTVDIVSPDYGTVVENGVVTIEAEATDESGITKVELLINGFSAFTANSAPYRFEWDVTGLAEGDYLLEAAAWDNAGNTTLSPAVKVTVATPAKEPTEPEKPVPPDSEPEPEPEPATDSFTFSGNAPMPRQGNTVNHSFEVRGSGTLEASLTWGQKNGDLDLYLYGPSGNLLAVSKSSNRNNLVEFISQAVNPGTYTLKVEAASGKGNYTLAVLSPR